MADRDPLLVPCTLNGMQLPLKSFTDHHARALAVHSYKDIPGGDVDDAGAEPLWVDLVVVLGGIAAHQNKRALGALIDNTLPPLVLTHPVYGTMPVAVKTGDSVWTAGTQRHEWTIHVVRDTPTPTLAMTPPIASTIVSAPAIAAVNADFSQLAALLMWLLAFVNALRSLILGWINFLGQLGYAAQYLEDVGASQIGEFGSLVADAMAADMSAMKSLCNYPEDLAAACQQQWKNLSLAYANEWGFPVQTLRDYESGARVYDSSPFANGRPADVESADVQTHAFLTLMAGARVGFTAAMIETASGMLCDADQAGTLTAAQATMTVNACYGEIQKSHRLARTILPGGQAAQACLDMAAGLRQLMNGLRIRSAYRQTVVLKTAPLFLILAEHRIDQGRLEEIQRANDLPDTLRVPVGAKIWIPAEAA
jgi:hypothetical protein